MEFTEKDLDSLSALARITVSEDEKSEMLTSIQSILGYISEINSVSGELVSEKSTVRNVMREDVVTEGGDARRVLANAPRTQDGFFVVPKVVE